VGTWFKPNVATTFSLAIKPVTLATAAFQSPQPSGEKIHNLLCAPCFAAMGAIKREMNNTKWFWIAIGYQCGFAYVCSLIVYQLGSLFNGGSFGFGTIVGFILLIGLIYLLVRPSKESDTAEVEFAVNNVKRGFHESINISSSIGCICMCRFSLSKHL